MKVSQSDLRKLIERLRLEIVDLTTQARGIDLTTANRKAFGQSLEKAAQDLNALVAELDLTKRPISVFDPGNPRTVGFFVALALLAQPRKKLSEREDFYGAGIYSIFYNGNFPLYSEIRRTETPIYVGQAVSGNQDAHTPIEQGRRLAARLNEHRKNIDRASRTLQLRDFEYKSLVIQSGWESTAENYLIRLFRPIWNKETKIIQGFGKHGDRATTRQNRKSTWDTLHPGRNWAGPSKANEQSIKQINAKVKKHFEEIKIYRSFSEVLLGFIETLRQV